MTWEQPIVRHGTFTKWNWLVYHPEHLSIGNNVDIGALTFLNAKRGIILEDGVKIGPHCSLFSVSTIDSKEGKIVLHADAAVGANSVIMPGVIINENAIVGAGAVVTAFTHIPANEVWAGTPARPLKKK